LKAHPNMLHALTFAPFVARRAAFLGQRMAGD